jgi:PucR C-terminal helix-turn-helix domain
VSDPASGPGAAQGLRQNAAATTAIGTAAGTGAWPAISVKIADQLRPVLPAVVEEMVADILATVPEYAQPATSGDGSYEHAVRRGAQEAASRFVDRIADPDAYRDQAAAVFRRLGEAEAGEGRSLEALQAALRAGARVALRWLTQASQWMEAPLETLSLLTDAMLVFLDEIAAESAEGYSRAQVAGDLHWRRRRLLGLLLAEPPAAGEAVTEMACLAQWRRPRLISVIVLAAHPRGPGVPALPAEVLQDLDRSPRVLIAPDPYGPGRRAMLDRCLLGFRGAVGPPVCLAEAGKSLHWAREALSLAEQGAFGEHTIVHCDDHLTEMVLHRGGDLLDRLEARRLAPLSDMPPGRQDMMAETLLAWLETGKSGSVASRLFIHPQTARYRLHKLQELFGEQLDNPDARFELALVLRARQASPQRQRPVRPA